MEPGRWYRANFSSVALAMLTDTPIIGEQLFAMQGVRVLEQDGFEDGNLAGAVAHAVRAPVLTGD
ncbi:MAG: hypothetical protein R3F38_07745 [Gammaproteobacteria bacterium]